MAVRIATTIVTPASSFDLVTLAVVKEELGVTDSKSDARLRRYITSASAVAAQECNRVFPKETVTDTFDIGRARLQYAGETSLQLTRFPVVAIASIAEADVDLVAGTDYRLDDTAGLLYRLDSSGNARSWISTPVVVTYDGGYDAAVAGHAPDLALLADATTRLVTGRWFARGRDPLAKQESIPGVRDVAYWIPSGADAGNIPPDVADIFNNFRVPVVG